MTRILPVALAVLSTPFAVASLAAQALERAAVPSESAEQSAEAAATNCLEVKLVEGSGAEWRDGQLISRTGRDLSAVQRWFDQAQVRPWITVMSWDQLDKLHRDACAKLPENNRPGHLGLWFVVQANDAEHAERLRVRLAAEPLVAHVYHEPQYVPASHTVPTMAVQGGDVPPTTPAFMAQQVPHRPSPDGHGFRLAAGVLGARGQTMGLRMIEQSWLFGHEDVCQLVEANVIGPIPAYDQNRSLHGLSGASIVIADRNAYGVTGIAEEASGRFLSVALNGGLGNALVLAIANSEPGDVVMIVIMALIPGLGPGTFLPIEFYQSVFDATLTVTAANRHVVVPAGNGNRSLDDPALLGRFDRSQRDSGALIVGASDGATLAKADFSNWGARIDAHGHGDGVISCGYGTLWLPPGPVDLLQSYTAAATGTSSSTPHLAGLVLMVQGAAKQQLGTVLSNQEIVDLIHAHGPQTPDVIGTRPDVVAIFEALGIFDGLRAAEPDVELGQSMVLDMDGPDGSLVALLGGFALADIDGGLNRNLHLDLPTMVVLGVYPLTGGSAQYQLPVPVNASLHGVDIFFQALRSNGTEPLHLSNSCQVTIL